MMFGCGTKTPFEKRVISQSVAQVYVYAPAPTINGEDTTDLRYQVYINSKRVSGTILESEYKVFNIKPSKSIISIRRDDTEEKKINLDLKAGYIYYLKIIDDSRSGTFEFLQIEDDLALQEIVETDLAGSMKIETSEIFVDETKVEAVESKEISVGNEMKSSNSEALSGSVVDEITKAYELKQNGVLSEEEFKRIKVKLLQ
jgi:hypothetical protein